MAANNARLPRCRNSTYHKWSQELGVEMIRMSMYLYLLCYNITGKNDETQYPS